MNTAKKAFCRVYQGAFHAALPVLPYREPEIMNRVEEIAPWFQKKRIGNVLLITDGFLRSSGMTGRLEKALHETGITCVVYDRTRPNPTVENVAEAFELYRQNRCGGLIAFGGGSSIDCAKAVGARAAYHGLGLEHLKGNLRIMLPLPTLVAVPTTAGTGSEVTVTAVITDDEKHHKYTMNSFPLIPDAAVLDPTVTYSLPPHLTATTGIDALTHAVEAYIGRSTSRETRQKALAAAHLIFANIETAYHDPENYKARANMLRAAYLAGVAFSKSYVGYVHAVAHSLGGQYNIPHGLANSVLLPIVLEDYGVAVHHQLHNLAIIAGVASKSDPHAVAAGKFIKAVRDLNSRLGIPEKLSGILEEDIPAMAKHADREANPLYPVPVLMNAKELEKFYYKVADWN